MTFTIGFRNIFTMTRRCLYYTLRNVDGLLTMLFLPVVIMFLFNLMGNAFSGGDGSYINYMFPGALILSIGYGAGGTAINLNADLRSGIVNRFRTMPIGRNTIFMGHVLASVLRNIVSTILLTFLAFLMGFHPRAGLAEWFTVIGVLLLYTLAMTWISILFGLLSKTPEGASAFSYVFLCLPYASSAFMPIETMPAPLQFFAKYQPITPICESIRALLSGIPSGNFIIISVVWCLGITIVSYFITIYIFNKKPAFSGA